MQVEFGHTHPVDGQVVSVAGMSDDREGEHGDGAYVLSYKVGTTGEQIRDEMFDIMRGATPHFGGNTAVADITQWLNGHPDIDDDIAWVAVDAEDRDPAEAADFERFLAEYLRCEQGRPDDVHDTHWTLDTNLVTSLPPGVHPTPDPEG